MGNLNFDNLKPYALTFLAGVTVASVVWVFLVPKNSSDSSSLQKVAGDSVVGVGSSDPKLGRGNPAPTLIIDVSGAVAAPGVYQLPDGSRVGDALAAAGGALADKIDTEYVAKQINLASEIRDGQKIYVPFRGESVAGVGGASLNTPANSISNPISVNTATAAELDTLAGVGPATAAKIISGRPYSKLEELVTKKALSQSVFENIKDKLQL